MIEVKFEPRGKLAQLDFSKAVEELDHRDHEMFGFVGNHKDEHYPQPNKAAFIVDRMVGDNIFIKVLDNDHGLHLKEIMMHPNVRFSADVITVRDHEDIVPVAFVYFFATTEEFD